MKKTAAGCGKFGFNFTKDCVGYCMEAEQAISYNMNIKPEFYAFLIIRKESKK